MKGIPGIHGAMFGLMDGIITTIGVVLGMSAFGNQPTLIIAAMAAALANSIANAAGVHVGTESSRMFSQDHVMLSTAYAFLSTLVVSITVIIPHFFLPLIQATWLSVAVGAVILGAMGFFVARYRNRTPWKIILEYVAIGLIVSLVTYLGGQVFAMAVVI